MTKKRIEVDEDEIVIVVKPKLDKNEEWIHETNVHFSKKNFKDEKAAIALSELCRAMVGFSYAATNDDLLFYSGVFHRILEGEFKENKRVLHKKDNVIFLDGLKDE